MTEENSVSSAKAEADIVPEKKPTVKKESAPTPPRRKADSVVGTGATDEVSHARYLEVAEGRTRARRVLTIHHVQRVLAEAGQVTEGSAARIVGQVAENHLSGRYGAQTEAAVAAWQKSHGYKDTGILTSEQFEKLFDGDPNVTVVA